MMMTTTTRGGGSGECTLWRGKGIEALPPWRVDLLHDVDVNIIFVVHSAFFAWHVSDNTNEASQ